MRVKGVPPVPFAPTGSFGYGNLYIALGDGGSGNDPQENGEDPSNPYGAILRIDPLGSDASNGKYGLVTANGLASDGNPGTLAEIFCYGLRNPQRFGWDSETGNFFIADIGQNAVEEINLSQNGGNFGWDHREGSFPFESSSTTGLLDPVAEYDHTSPVADMPTAIENRAVTLGEVTRDSSIHSYFPSIRSDPSRVYRNPPTKPDAGIQCLRGYCPSAE